MFITGALSNKHTLCVCVVFCLSTVRFAVFFVYQNDTSQKASPWHSRTPHPGYQAGCWHLLAPLTRLLSSQFSRLCCPQTARAFPPSHSPSADLSWQDSCSLKCSCQALSHSGSSRTQRWQLHLVSAEPKSHFMTDLELCFQKRPKLNNLTEINGAANALLPDTRAAPAEHQLLKLPFLFFKKVSTKIVQYWVFLVKRYSVWAKAFFIYTDKNLTLVYRDILFKAKEAFSP